MSFFFQTVAGILRGSTNDSADRCCRNHFCHHQGDQGGSDGVDRLIERSPRRHSLKPPTAAAAAAVAVTSATSQTTTTTTFGDLDNYSKQGGAPHSDGSNDDIAQRMTRTMSE